MAKRQTFQRVKTDSLQGPGSYVDLRRPNWGEMKAVGAELQEIISAGENVNEVLTTKMEALLVDHFQGWNWCDGDGKPLGSLADELNGLTDEEIELLLNAVGDMFNPQKKTQR